MKVADPSRSVTVLQHLDIETPGLLQPILQAQGINLNVVRIDRDEPVPAELGESRGLIVMGGPMGVHDTDEYPWLKQEMKLIEKTLDAELPLLGICLGSQLLATVLGSRVATGVAPEYGWELVELTPAARRDPLWQGVSSPFTAFHWHADVYECPPETTQLARSANAPCQSFRYGTNAYGLLFHLEMTAEQISDLAQRFADDTGPYVSRAAIDRGTNECLAPAKAMADEVFGAWAGLLGS